jgi:hypothetical protein
LWDVETGDLVGKPIRVQGAPDIDVKPIAPDDPDAEPHPIPGTPLTFTLHSENGILFAVVNNDTVYNLSTTSGQHQTNELPPSLVIDRKIQYDASWTLIHSRFNVRFRLPPNFLMTRHKIHQGKIAYGAMDGSVTIVDCTHLF